MSNEKATPEPSAEKRIAALREVLSYCKVTWLPQALAHLDALASELERLRQRAEAAERDAQEALDIMGERRDACPCAWREGPCDRCLRDKRIAHVLSVPLVIPPEGGKTP